LRFLNKISTPIGGNKIGVGILFPSKYGNMRSTSQRAERCKLRLQYLSRSYLAVQESTGKFLADSGMDNYSQNQKLLLDAFLYLGTAFNWQTLVAKKNGST
jgi:hypothetical protein